MLSLNIPQVHFIAAVYAVTKRSITQAHVVISSQSRQPTPKMGWEGLGHSCLLACKWSDDPSPSAGLLIPEGGCPPGASQRKSGSQSPVFMSLSVWLPVEGLASGLEN